MHVNYNIKRLTGQMHPQDETSGHYVRRRNQANNNASVHSSIGQV